ncbi:MAG: EI24 domain-containing protein [Vicinamibacteria bacterium]|nr:EI24 domain-containing protein [Vicinamibacteria bacterium]
MTELVPSLPRRLLAGAWHAPAGAGFLLRRPRLWPLAVLPTLLAGGLVLAGLLLAAWAAPTAEEWLLPGHRQFSIVVEFLIRLSLWLGLLAGGAVCGLALALLLASPVIDLLSRRIEQLERGEVVDQGRGLRWEVVESVKGALRFLAAAPFVFVIGLVPFVGAPLALLWAGHAAAWQQTENALGRRGMGYAERRAWHRRFRAETLGFGVAAVLPLLVPLLNVLLAPLVVPALAIGGTRLVLELEADAAAAGQAEPVPPPTEPTTT